MSAPKKEPGYYLTLRYSKMWSGAWTELAGPFPTPDAAWDGTKTRRNWSGDYDGAAMFYVDEDGIQSPVDVKEPGI